MAGIAAAVCTLLNTPFAAAIFAAEVVYSQRIVYRTLLYPMISVICVYALNNRFGIVGTLFPPTPHAMSYTVKEYVEVAAVAVFCSLPTGLGIKAVFNYLKEMFTKIPFITRAPVGALLTAGIGLGAYYGLEIDIDHVLGMGENTVHDLINNHGNPGLKVWWIIFAIVFLKCVTTGLTLMAGGSAGLLVPAMVLGGASGAGVFYLIQDLGLGFLVTKDMNLFVISGVAASLVAVAQVPVAAILIVTEMFGSTFAPPAMISVVICHLMVKRCVGIKKKMLHQQQLKKKSFFPKKT